MGRRLLPCLGDGIWGAGTDSKSCWPCRKLPLAGAGLRRGVTSGFPASLGAHGVKHPHDGGNKHPPVGENTRTMGETNTRAFVLVTPRSLEQQAGLGVCSGSRAATGKPCGVADVLAARSYLPFPSESWLSCSSPYPMGPRELFHPIQTHRRLGRERAPLLQAQPASPRRAVGQHLGTTEAEMMGRWRSLAHHAGTYQTSYGGAWSSHDVPQGSHPVQ